MLKRVTWESGYAPIACALLKLGDALFCYNSTTRFYTQTAVAIENCISGINKSINLKYTALEKKEWDGLIYTIFSLSGYQLLGEALTITRDLIDLSPTSIFKHCPDVNKTFHILYDLTYLGLYFSPQGYSFIVLLKVSKVAYFVFKEYSVCSHTWSRIQKTIEKPTLVNAIHFLANGIHLYGSSLQLYTACHSAS